MSHSILCRKLFSLQSKPIYLVQIIERYSVSNPIFLYIFFVFQGSKFSFIQSRKLVTFVYVDGLPIPHLFEPKLTIPTWSYVSFEKLGKTKGPPESPSHESFPEYDNLINWSLDHLCSIRWINWSQKLKLKTNLFCQ